MSDVGLSGRVPTVSTTTTNSGGAQSAATNTNPQTVNATSGSGGSGSSTSGGDVGDTAVNVSDNLARLVDGGPFEGVVGDRNTIRLLGQSFVFGGNANLAAGSKVIAHLQADGAFLKAQVTSLNGRPLQPPLQLQLAPDPAAATAVGRALDQIAGQSAYRQATVLGTTAGATVINIGGQAYRLGGPPDFGAGSELTLKLVDPHTAQVLSQDGRPLMPPRLVSLQQIGPQGLLGLTGRELNGLVTMARPEAALAPGTGLKLLVLDPEAAMNGPNPGQGTILAGLVAGQDGRGRTLVQTGAGMLALTTSEALGGRNLALGTRMALEVLELTPPETNGPLLGKADPAGKLDRDWNALKDLLSRLQASDGDLARRLLAALPQANNQLAAMMARMTEAMKTGSFAAWVGRDITRAIDRAAGRDALRAADDDFKDLSQLANDQRPNSWSSFPLPFVDNGELRQGELYVRRRQKRPEDSEGLPPGTRFVFDIALKKTGPLQFDGLIRERHLDLILRSDQALPEDWRQDIRNLYMQTMAATGFDGMIVFQAGVPRVTPRDDIRQAAHFDDAIVI